MIVGLFVLAWPAVLRAHPGAHHDVERVSKLLDAEPLRADLWIERAHHRRLAGEFEAALVDLAEAERLTPGDWNVSAHRGLTLARMGRLDEAEAELNRFLENTSGTAVTFAQRAQIRQTTGRTDLAIDDLSASLALTPDVERYLQRGEWQELLKRWDDAAAGYQEALESVGPVGSIQEGLVRVELARGNHDQALALIDAAIMHTNTKSPWRLRRAQVLESAGRLEEARAERLVALDETNRVLGKRVTAIQLVLRAQVNIALDRTDDARLDLELALKKSPRYEAAIKLMNTLGPKRNEHLIERSSQEGKRDETHDEK
jgi:tetratricopeptide (TPR) repeat protein